jgi:hypothetical protein
MIPALRTWSVSIRHSGPAPNVPQHILVVIAQLLEDGGGGLCGRSLVVVDAVHVQVVLDNVCNCLGVCGGTGSTAPDGVVNLGEFVGNAVGNVSASGGSTVCAEDNTILEVDGHAGNSSVR